MPPISSTSESNDPADFEEAIEACGFGLFNICLLFVCSFCLTAMVFSASAMSYILPTADCDLKMSLFEKGMLNAVTYAGMIISAVPWGFIADTMGRKIVLICGGWIDCIFVLCASLSQSPTQLMIFKFLDGLIICGPFAVVVSYLVEFHGKAHRPYIMIFVGITVSLAALMLPIIAYFLLPNDIYFSVWKLNFHSWHLFVACTAVPAWLSGLLHIFLPESPKFLLSQGKYSKAMSTFQIIYSWNHHKPRDSYPITDLIDPTPDRQTSSGEQNDRAKMKLIAGFKQLKPMFSSPYLSLSLRVYALHFCQVLSVNTIRLWLPQIFATMRHFETIGAKDTSMCSVLEYNANLQPAVHNETDHCLERPSGMAYVDNIGVSCIGIVGFMLLFPIIRIKKISNHILKFFLLVGTLSVGALYFSDTTLCTMILAAIYLLVMGICATTVIYVCVIIFPTLMRTMVVALIMTFGRIGSVCGNILFPAFLHLGCIAPFIWICILMLIAFGFSLFLPTDNKNGLG